MEIVNTSTTISSTFAFTPFGDTAVSAVATSRAIPPMATLYERLPRGCGGISALALAAGGSTLIFTPGVTNG